MILDNGRCLLASDIEHCCHKVGNQYHFHNNFCQSTRIDLRSGKFCRISPIYVESGKYVFELKTNDKVYVLRTLSMYAMWTWIRAIHEAFTYWSRTNKRNDDNERPSWVAGHWRAYIEIENAHDKVLVGMGLLDLDTSFILSLELHENVLDKAGKVLNIGGGRSPDDEQHINLDGLCSFTEEDCMSETRNTTPTQ